MKLYFLRHGLAGDRQDWEGSDSERPLTDEGKEKMKRSAALIASIGLEPDAILTSPLVRAHQTAAIVAAALQAKGKLVVDDRLGPGFDADAVAAILRDHPTCKSLMMVGHEPGMSTTVSRLIGGGRIVCKKGGLACVRIIEPASLEGELLWLVPPRILALQAE